LTPSAHIWTIPKSGATTRTSTSALDRIGRLRGTAINEQNTKAALIAPILRALGWDLEDVDEVSHEYRRLSSDYPVDYALLLLRTPRLFVEAKPLDANLDDRHWADQILVYAMHAGVQWVVLTNGDEYRVYNAHAVVPFEEKLFRSVRLSDDTTRAEDLLDLIAKERMRENWIDTLWKAHFVDRQIRAAIEGLFSPEPDPSLVRLIARRVSALSAADIRSGLGRARLHLDFPVEPLAVGATRAAGLRVLAPGPVTPPAQLVVAEQPPPSGRRRSTAQRRDAVSLQDLIASGLIHPPLGLEKTYLGQQLSAQVERDGRVTFRGRPYDSLSTAGGAARASVPGAPDDREFPQTNGWTFWRFRDSDGRSKLMDELRQRYRAAKPASAS
jgi:hypothetical protein